MCIRDRIDTPYLTEGSSGLTFAVDRFKGWPHGGHITLARGCLLYTSDAADERSSVDLGGRRILQKKKKIHKKKKRMCTDEKQRDHSRKTSEERETNKKTTTTRR